MHAVQWHRHDLWQPAAHTIQPDLCLVPFCMSYGRILLHNEATHCPECWCCYAYINRSICKHTNLSVQVHFIVNNLSTANLPSKGTALTDLLPKEFWPWFANYMVVKRAAQVLLAHATSACMHCFGRFAACCICQATLALFVKTGAQLPWAVPRPAGQAGRQEADGESCGHNAQVHPHPACFGPHQDAHLGALSAQEPGHLVCTRWLALH
jgi:CCR4-NOT transcription complex subunit 1 CAF1-binding domain